MYGFKAYRSEKTHRLKPVPLLAWGAVAVFGIAIASGQQPARSGPFTAAQADAGRVTYQSKCASCHLPDLKGSNEAPPLAGGNFVNAWRNRTTADLYSRIRNTMPLSNPGSLSDREAVTIVAYILRTNGAAAGNQVLTADTLVPIGAVVAGEGSAAVSQAVREAPSTPASAPAPRLLVRLSALQPMAK